MVQSIKHTHSPPWHRVSRPQCSSEPCSDERELAPWSPKQQDMCQCNHQCKLQSQCLLFSWTSNLFYVSVLYVGAQCRARGLLSGGAAQNELLVFWWKRGLCTICGWCDIMSKLAASQLASVTKSPKINWGTLRCLSEKVKMIYPLIFRLNANTWYIT